MGSFGMAWYLPCLIDTEHSGEESLILLIEPLGLRLS